MKNVFIAGIKSTIPVGKPRPEARSSYGNLILNTGHCVPGFEYGEVIGW